MHFFDTQSVLSFLIPNRRFCKLHFGSFFSPNRGLRKLKCALFCVQCRAFFRFCNASAAVCVGRLFPCYVLKRDHLFSTEQRVFSIAPPFLTYLYVYMSHQHLLTCLDELMCVLARAHVSLFIHT